MGGTLTGYNQPEAFYSSLNQFGLYNGNIAHTVADIKALNQDPQAYVYRYDQLNRLTQMHVANNSIANIDNWTFKNDYNERIGYDPNGNILNYWRNGTTSGGSPLAMDSLTYHYQPGTNKLDYVDDAVDAANYSVDIDDEDTLNYRYDAIGNLTKDVSEGIDTILWNVYGKIQEIDKANGDTLHFAYDATGNRIMKEYWNDSLQKRTHTFYVRDATGNIMATYLWENMDTFKLDELVMYGSSRLGVIHPDRILYTDSLGSDTTMPDITSYATNFKQYELTNHLGNVLVTIGDRKLPVYVSGAYNHYEAEAVSANDYYPFGMLMPGRNYNANSYRFGMMGFEKDDEIKGVGNHLSFGDYGFDPRVVRRWNVDPKSAAAPHESPYLFAGGNPIYFIDPDGKFKLNYTEESLKENGLTKLDVVRFEIIVNNISNLVKDNPQALAAIANTTGFSQERILDDFKADNGPTVDILSIGGGAKGGASGIIFDPAMIKALSSIDGSDKTELSNQTLGTALTLLHEYGHYGDQVTNDGNNTGQFSLDVTTNASGGTNPKRKYDSQIFGGKNIDVGKQKWKTSLTGHRGTDIETVGFGVQVSVDNAGKTIIEKGKLSPTTSPGAATVPSSLPNNAQGENVLKTLDVE